MMASPGASHADPTPSRIELDVDRSNYNVLSGWPTASTTAREEASRHASGNTRRLGDVDERQGHHDAWEDERKDLLMKLASMESTKEKEVDHLRVRVAQLTKRVAELETSLATVHRALEEEAATAIGLQRNIDIARSRFALSRWRERATLRRLRRETQSNAALTAAVREALTLLPTAAGGNSAPMMRKALEELAWCERQWADQRLEHLKQSSQAFRGLAQRQRHQGSSSPSAFDSTPRHSEHDTAVDQQALASTMSSAKVLLERADGIAAAKFQVLLQSFQSYARCDKVHQLLDDAMRRATPHTVGGVTPAVDERVDGAPRSSSAKGARTDVERPLPSDIDQEKHVLLRSMRYDVLRDTIHSIVTVVILPPALQMLEDAVHHHPVLARLMEGIDELLLQHPLSLQVERCLQTCFSKHFRLHSTVEAAGGKVVDGRPLPHGSHVATATLVVEEPPTMGRRVRSHPVPGVDAASTRQVLHGHPTSDAASPRKSTPVNTTRTLRCDLVHSILDEAHHEPSMQRGASTPRVTHALRRRTEIPDSTQHNALIAEQTEDSSIGRLEHARRSVRQSHRSSAL
jgi:hypothetical protein